MMDDQYTHLKFALWREPFIQRQQLGTEAAPSKCALNGVGRYVGVGIDVDQGQHVAFAIQGDAPDSRQRANEIVEIIGRRCADW